MNLSAIASDNVGVAGVRFYLNGAPFGSDLSATPYTLVFDSSTQPNGTYTVTARAWDAAGNSSTSAPVAFTISNVAVPLPPGPYHGTPFAVPGRLEAEDFDRGGEGVAYHDKSRGNQGGFYRRDEDVDILNPYTSGYTISSFETGEYLNYTISVAQPGSYRIEALVSSIEKSGQLRISVDGNDVTGTLNVPRTGSWKSFQRVGKSGITLGTGTHLVTVQVQSEPFHLDALVFTLESSKPGRRRSTGP